jgi:Ca-activated chloride channel family protein
VSRWHLAVPVLAALLAVTAAAQERRPPAVFSAGLDVVNLAVAVLDERGHPVSDLSAEDFVVLEDGRPQALRLFARAVEPGQEEALALDLGLLLDTSESMLQTLKLSQQAAVRFLDSIPRARDLLTVFFDQDIRVSRYDSESQQGLFDRIAEAKSAGTTALYDAIAVYLSRIQDSPGRKVMVLLSDGEDTTSSVTAPEVVQMLRSSPVTVYSIAIMGGLPQGSGRVRVARAFLQDISELTGGHIFLPSAAADLPGIYRSILEELSAQYVLGWVSDDPKQDGRFRKLKVEVKRKGLKARHRQGYTAPVAPARAD